MNILSLPSDGLMCVAETLSLPSLQALLGCAKALAVNEELLELKQEKEAKEREEAEKRWEAIREEFYADEAREQDAQPWFEGLGGSYNDSDSDSDDSV